MTSRQINSIIHSTPKPPQPMHELIRTAKLIKQGAEAKVYKTTLYPTPTVTQPFSSSSSSSSTASSTSAAPSTPSVEILIKHRFSKQYRHPTLDAQLIRARLTAEARSLVRCLKAGVRVPGLRMVDLASGVLGIEWIEGNSVREVLGGGQEEDEGAEMVEIIEDEPEEAEDDVVETWHRRGLEQDTLLDLIGESIAQMHLANIIHGDLTTSNMMVREAPPTSAGGASYEVVLIDFGLSSVSLLPEDRAVDLYVLERAFSSTHPVPLLPSGEEGEPHFARVLRSYACTMQRDGKKGEWDRVEKRLDEVRGRGRKRSMVG